MAFQLGIIVFSSDTEESSDDKPAKPQAVKYQLLKLKTKAMIMKEETYFHKEVPKNTSCKKSEDGCFISKESEILRFFSPNSEPVRTTYGETDAAKTAGGSGLVGNGILKMYESVINA